MYSYWMSIHLLLFFLPDILCVQTWEEEPSYKEVNPGESATLACKIYNKKGTCSWQKDGKPQGIFEGKIEWAGDQLSGDCSIRVLDASEVDDGLWECQVTASSFSAHDALTSQIARLIVRVAPDPPQFERGSSKLNPPTNFTVREGTPAHIKCTSRHGNPPSIIKWFLGSEPLPPSSYNQTNMTEIGQSKKYTAVSHLQTTFLKGDHGRLLRCVSVHEAYGMKSKDVNIALNVQYAPTVTLQGSPTGDIEEGKDRVALQCLADANPPASVIWKRVGDDNVFSFQETIAFDPILRKHSGTYNCRASNDVGNSDPLTVRLNVKYEPMVVTVGPEPVITANLKNKTVLNCHAKGDPPPNYKWLQVTSSGRKTERGTNTNLTIDSVTYDDQGQYFCVAFNFIKGTKREDNSNPVVLEVMGAPQVLRYMVRKDMVVNKGDDAVIQMVFCSDPKALRTTWEWGPNQMLDSGNGKGRFVAERLSQETGSQDCYTARLRIQDVKMTDARSYYLTVSNEKGEDRYAVDLEVKEPITMSTIIGIVTACLVLLVLVTIVMFYAFKAERCCFAHLSLSPYPIFISNLPKSSIYDLKVGFDESRMKKFYNNQLGEILFWDLPPPISLSKLNKSQSQPQIYRRNSNP